MIYIGSHDKVKLINEFKEEYDHIFVIGTEDISGIPEHDFIIYKDTILYKNYYDLQARITNKSLVIFNEPLVSNNRHLLNYNCMRKYVLARPYRMIFQTLPIVKNKEDFLILYDLDSDSPYLKLGLNEVKLKADIGELKFNWNVEETKLDEKELVQYKEEKAKIIASVLEDPDIIPRRLLKFSEKLNAKHFGSKNTKDPKNVIKLDMNIGLNQTGVDKYYYEEMKKFKIEVTELIDRIKKDMENNTDGTN